MHRIAIIGAGLVGSTTAYALTLKNAAAEVLLIDVNEAKETGEVMDIRNTLSLVETGRVHGADFTDAASADMIIITAGFSQRAGKADSRLDLLEKNADVIRAIFAHVGPIRKDAIILVVSNPVDVLTALAHKLSGLPRAQVFGTGTTLDTARLRMYVAEHCNVHPQDVSGFVVGEHGNSQVTAWSSVHVGGIPVQKLPRWSGRTAKNIAAAVEREAYEIIDRKGATHFGIAAVVTDIVEAVLFDQKHILPVSTHAKKWNGMTGVCMGIPATVGRSGVERLWPLPLSAAESRALGQSATVLRGCLRHVL